MRDKKETLDKTINNLKIKKLAKEQKFQERGITLIALVVTIIILLILAGVTLNIALSDNGLFSKTKKAAEDYEKAQEDEEKETDRVQASLSEYNGKTEGKRDSSKNRTLSGETTGYTYKNPIIPQGFTAVDDGAGWYYKDEEQTEVKGWNDGLVIEDNEGNQFVWVPCSIEESGEIVKYEKTNFSEYEEKGELYKDAIPVDDEDEQIRKYGGFYVARYETGCSDGNIPKSKYGLKVWNNVSLVDSVGYAKQMINDDSKYGSTKSGLITAKQWDTICAWFAGSHESIKSIKQDWGSYFDLNYSVNGIYIWESSDGGAREEGFITHKANISPVIYHASGLNSNGYKKSIADLAGNYWEWTAETFGTDGNDNLFRISLRRRSTTEKL